MKQLLLLVFLLLGFAWPAKAQTSIQSGPVNPTNCNPGAYFYNTTTALYQQCGPANTWTQAGGSSSPSSLTNSSGYTFYLSGAGCTTPSLTGTTVCAKNNQTIARVLIGHIARFGTVR